MFCNIVDEVADMMIKPANIKISRPGFMFCCERVK